LEKPAISDLAGAMTPRTPRGRKALRVIEDAQREWVVRTWTLCLSRRLGGRRLESLVERGV
jgi:hypothetical protein